MQKLCTVNFAYNDTRRGINKVSLFAKCRYTRSLIIMYYSGMGLFIIIIFFLFYIGSSTVQLHKYEEADGTKKIYI